MWGITETLVANIAVSICAGFAAHHFIRQFIPVFVERRLYGFDMCKRDKEKIAEPMGVVAAAVYLIFVFAFIPVPFYEWLSQNILFAGAADNRHGKGTQIEREHFPYENLLSMLAGLTETLFPFTILFFQFLFQCFPLLFYVLDLRWRHKLLFPALSSLPLLLLYLVSRHPTAMVLPNFLHAPLGGISYVELGPLYYLFILMLVVFCTNAINIIAGINGVEVGQSLVIATSIALFNIFQVFRLSPDSAWHHSLSLCFLLPFIGTSFALFWHNKFPARVFVGDTYCYWAGMTIAVCAIAGRFSKTILLFLVPQVLNFLYSCPQLFHLIPCPRHRLPRLNTDTDRLEMSMAEFQPHKLPLVGQLCLRVLIRARLVHHEEFDKDGERWSRINNLTILNFILKVFGPLHEERLTNSLLAFQFACSVVAFFLRFSFACLLYDTVN
ncbi:hypothetical protein niasHS_010162 [Heterodera schachtii]|uniref:UDP-N-acetylglucosamine--dolichyl-phosphate N-acetylglucosaminephosphotransferase n=1 Tax=Heterodera schachtii TaxID=97005 RepID=A0ABD2IZG4_HETSC